MKSLRLLAVGGLACAALAGMVTSAAGTYGTHDCGHMTTVTLGSGGAYVTTDPAQLVVNGQTYTISSRALVVSYHSFELIGVPANNTYGCMFDGVMPQEEQRKLLDEYRGDVSFLVISVDGSVKVESYPLPQGTWTPQPTATAFPTATATADSNPFRVFMAMVARGVSESQYPTPTPSVTSAPPSAPYEQGDCGTPELTVNVGPNNSVWVTTDAQSFRTTNQSVVNYPERLTILATSSIWLTTTKNTHFCAFTGWPTDEEIKGFQSAAGTRVLVIDRNGVIIDTWLIE